MVHDRSMSSMLDPLRVEAATSAAKSRLEPDVEVTVEATVEAPLELCSDTPHCLNVS